MTEEEAQRLKIVVVGDGAVGKTSFLMTYTQGSFPMEYMPTVLDNYIMCGQKNNKDLTINFVDTPGQEDYRNLRSLAYSEVSVFLVCFSVVNVTSFSRVWTSWLPEIRASCGKDVKTLLVGLQADLRTSDENESVEKKEAMKMASSNGMYAYKECSARTCLGCEEVVEAAMEAALKPQAKTECCVLL